MFHNRGSIIAQYTYVIYSIENDLVRLWIHARALPLDPRSLALRFIGFTHSACHYYSQLFSTTQIGLATNPGSSNWVLCSEQCYFAGTCSLISGLNNDTEIHGGGGGCCVNGFSAVYTFRFQIILISFLYLHSNLQYHTCESDYMYTAILNESL